MLEAKCPIFTNVSSLQTFYTFSCRLILLTRTHLYLWVHSYKAYLEEKLAEIVRFLANWWPQHWDSLTSQLIIMTAEFKNTKILGFRFSWNEYGPHFEVDSWPSKARKAKNKHFSQNIFNCAASLNIFHYFTKYFYLVPVRLSARWSALVIMFCMLARWAEQLGGGASPGDTERWTLRAPGPSHTTLGGGLKISATLLSK